MFCLVFCHHAEHTVGAREAVLQQREPAPRSGENTVRVEWSEGFRGSTAAWYLLSPEPQLLAEVPHSGSRMPCPPILSQLHEVPHTTQLRAHPVSGPMLAARDVELAGRCVNSSS